MAGSLSPPLRVVFFGTAELACASLDALAKSDQFDVVAVVTQPDRRQGRKLRLQPSPVKALAVERDRRILQPERARDETFLSDLIRLAPDLIIVAAYGQILPKTLLEIPTHGCLNVHASLLPRYRGAAPIQWAILNDDAETGVTIMKVAEGLDTGDMLSKAVTPIHSTDNASTLHDRLAQMGADLLLRTIPGYLDGSCPGTSQDDHLACYARKITKDDGRIDWTMTARANWNKVRAFTPWPTAHTFLPKPDGRLLIKIWEAEPLPGEDPVAPGTILESDRLDSISVVCGEGRLRIHTLQKQGARPLPASTFLSGTPLSGGTRFD